LAVVAATCYFYQQAMAYDVKFNEIAYLDEKKIGAPKVFYKMSKF